MNRTLLTSLGLSVGAAVAALAAALSFPAADPSVWRDVADAVGLRPDGAVTPVLWRLLVGHGVSLSVLGAVCAGVFAAAVFDIVWRILCLLVSPVERMPRWWSLTVPAVALAATVLAAFSEPVWRLALTGGPALLELALMALAIDLSLTRFFAPWGSRTANVGAYAAFLVAGVLAVETPVGLLLPPAFALLHRTMAMRMQEERYRWHPAALAVRMPEPCAKWGAFLLWAAGVLVVFATAAARTDGGVFLRLAAGAFRSVLVAATPFGWLLWTGFALVPLVIATGVLQALTRDGRRLEFAAGIAMLVSGLLAYGQVSPVASARFWRLIEGATPVASPLMLAIGTTLAAFAVALTLALFAYFAFHLMPPDYPPRNVLAVAVSLALAFAFAASLIPAGRGEARSVREVIVAAMDETVRECEGVRWVFTDGTCDAGVELAAARSGKTLYTLPMIEREGGFSRELRTRGLADEADRTSALTGVAALLRDWVSADSSNLTAAAVQIGLELWKRERRTPPEVSGLVARPGGFPADGRERGIAAAEALADRMLELSASGALAREDDVKVRNAFAAIQWRIARMARLRGDEGRADQLDAANGVLKRIVDEMARERSAVFMQMTDEEGLAIALKRADFVEARRFAAGVLRRNADNASANFGMGMSYLLEEKLDFAQPYLEAAHRARPTEPAFLNNLAILYLKKGKREKALEFAQEAARLAPNIPEVQATLKRVKANSHVPAPRSETLRVR